MTPTAKGHGSRRLRQLQSRRVEAGAGPERSSLKPSSMRHSGQVEISASQSLPHPLVFIGIHSKPICSSMGSGDRSFQQSLTPRWTRLSVDIRTNTPTQAFVISVGTYSSKVYEFNAKGSLTLSAVSTASHELSFAIRSLNGATMNHLGQMPYGMSMDTTNLACGES